jgi:hypothetical protein
MKDASEGRVVKTWDEIKECDGMECEVRNLIGTFRGIVAIIGEQAYALTDDKTGDAGNDIDTRGFAYNWWLIDRGGVPSCRVKVFGTKPSKPSPKPPSRAVTVRFADDSDVCYNDGVINGTPIAAIREQVNLLRKRVARYTREAEKHGWRTQ